MHYLKWPRHNTTKHLFIVSLTTYKEKEQQNKDSIEAYIDKTERLLLFSIL